MIGRRDTLREELSALDELDQEARRPVRRPSSLIVPILITMIVMTGSVTVAWYSYNAGVKEGSEGAAPLLKPAGPMKVAPDNPGGANIPHQEMSVYQSLNEKTDGGPVERILPPPERPLTPPVAAPAQPAGESSRVRSADSLPIAPPEAPKAGDSTPSARSLVPPPTALVPPKAQVAQAERNTPEPKAAEPAPKEIKAAPVKPVDKPARTAAPVKPAAEPEQQVASIPAGAYRIQLGSVSSEGQASKFWSAQREKNGDLLGKLALNVEKTSVGGKVFYRIQAGPMKDAASARALCDQLKHRQIGCIIVNPKK